MKSIFYTLAIFGFVGLVYSSCPELEPESDYSDDDLLHDWALLASTDKTDPNFAKLTCEDMYAYKEGNTYHLTGNGIDIVTHKKISNWTETGEQKGKAGHFHFVNPKYGNFDLTVIGKTSDSVILYSCQFPFNGTPFVWVYHKDHHSKYEALSLNEQTALTNILVNKGIRPDTLKFHDNSAC